MANNTYVALATQTLSSAVSSVTFSSIPQGYTDLVIVMNVIANSNANYLWMQYNGDTGSNYSTTIMTGSGSSAISTRFANRTNFNIDYYATPATTPGQRIVQIMNYSNTTTYKTGLVRAGRASGTSYSGTSGTDAIVGLWRKSPIEAINSILITCDNDTFQAGSTFTIYGIANADNFTKATGGILYEDSTYQYHVFGSSGTFTPKQSLTADILVVAGGGGGAISGGGAGGVFYAQAQSLTSGTSYTCTVGSGGTAGNGTSPGTGGGSGVNSTFGALTAAVGGGGAGVENGTNFPNAGASGGSGGSGNPGGSSTQTSTGGTGYGFAGATSNTYTTPNYARGGGGGAGAAGNPSTSGTAPGGGGNGTSVFSSWLVATNQGQNISGTYYIAGGGGGSTYNGTGTSLGGYGGGGGGVIASSPGISGTTNTGGGGGGTGTGQTSGKGGSGIIIVRYVK